MKCLITTVVVFLLLSAAAQNTTNPKLGIPRRSDPVRLWSVDLSKDSDFETRLKVPEIVLRPPMLDFVSNDQIIVSFDDNVPTTDLPSMNPYGFHVLQVSSDSGKVGKRLLFKVLNDTSQAVPISGDGFVVLAGEELLKYSSTFEKSIGIPTPTRTSRPAHKDDLDRSGVFQSSLRNVASGCCALRPATRADTP